MGLEKSLSFQTDLFPGRLSSFYFITHVRPSHEPPNRSLEHPALLADSAHSLAGWQSLGPVLQDLALGIGNPASGIGPKAVCYTKYIITLISVWPTTYSSFSFPTQITSSGYHCLPCLRISTAHVFLHTQLHILTHSHSTITSLGYYNKLQPNY